jgi:hypothetical protein
MKQVLFFFLSLVFPGILFSQTILERYQKAEQFLPKNTAKLTKNVTLQLNEVSGTSDFWYKIQTEKVKNITISMIKTKKRTKLSTMISLLYLLPDALKKR